MIALDYDGTWTAHPALWRDFVLLCAAKGIPVVVVTNRGPEMPIGESLPVAVVYAAGRPKREAAEKHGHPVAIWIDDYPHLVDFGAGHPVTLAMGLP